MYRRLTIDGTVVDLPQSGLTYSIVYEVDSEGFVSGAYSKRGVELPSTGTNDTLFEDWYAAGVQNETTAPILKPFVFEDGGVQIISGQAELQSAVLMSDRYRFKARNYKVELYGINADWTIRLKDLRIRDLDFPIFVYDSSAVLQGWNAEYDSNDEYGFTLVKFKEWNVAGEVGIDEFTPFLFIKTILVKAFDTIGYNINSNFFETDVFKRLIMPLPLPDRYPEEFSQDYINVLLVEPGTTTPPTADLFYLFPGVTQPNLTTPYNAATGFYVCPFTGYYEVSLTANIVSASGTYLFNIVAILDSDPTGAINNQGGINFGTLLSPASGSNTGSLTYNVVYLQAGTTISLLNNFGGTDPTNVYSFTMSIVGEAEITFGTLIDFKYLLKDWKIIDMIKGLQHMFNLRFEATPANGSLWVDPADPYLYRQETPYVIPQQVNEGFYTTPIVDSTQGLDLDPAAELFNVCDIPEVTILKYMTDGDTEAYTEENNILGIYSAQYNLPQDRFNKEIDEKENPFFAKTIHTNDFTIQGASATTSLQVPLIYAQNYVLDPTSTDINRDIQPRILFFGGFRGLASDSLVNFNFSVVPFPPPISFMVNYNNPGDFNLSFATENIQNNLVPGLLESFWLQDFARKRIGKRLEAFYFWDLLSINSLSFRNKLLIDGLEWVLLKIDGFSAQSDTSTKTILLREQGPTIDDEFAIENTLLNGLINPIA